MKKRTKIDHIEFSRKGGLTTFERYGSEHYSKIQKKGVETIYKKYGKDYFTNMVKKREENRLNKLSKKDRNSLEKVADILSGKLN